MSTAPAGGRSFTDFYMTVDLPDLTNGASQVPGKKQLLNRLQHYRIQLLVFFKIIRLNRGSYTISFIPTGTTTHNDTTQKNIDVSTEEIRQLATYTTHAKMISNVTEGARQKPGLFYIWLFVILMDILHQS